VKRRSVIVEGLGAIGRHIAEAAMRDPAFRVAALVDSAEELAGKEVVEGVPPVFGNLADAHSHAPEANLVLQATTTWLEEVAPVILEAVLRDMSVVSTCEELAFPFVRHPRISESLHRVARNHRCAVVGTGINPGFLMDALPVALTSASSDIRRVRVERVFDPRLRREAFRKKVGLGLTRVAFEEWLTTGHVGHAGLLESGRLVAAGLGWDDVSWEGGLRGVEGKDGTMLGMIQTLMGTTPEGRCIELHFEANAGVTSSVDRIEVDGNPKLRLQFEGGVAGDPATAAAVIRAARVIDSAPRGLVTVLDLPARAWREY
jgi:4-hydroxy-tetrahydrodipicolinate reductase